MSGKFFKYDSSSFYSKKFKSLIFILIFSIFLYGSLSVLFSFNNIFELIYLLSSEIIIGLFLMIISLLLKFLRWNILLNSIKINLPLFHSARIWISSYAFTATPGKIGELVRSYILKREFKIENYKSLIALFIERFTDLVAVLFLLLLYSSTLINLIPFTFKIKYLMTFLLISGFIFLLIKKYRRKFLNKFFLKYQKDWNRNYLSIKSIFKIKTLFISVLIGSLAWYLEGIIFWILIRGLDIYYINLGEALVGHLSAGIIGAISLLPGGIGASEISSIGILNSYGLDLSISTAITILIRLMTLWFASLIGFIFLILTLKKNKIKT